MSGDVELLIPNVTDLSILCLMGRQLHPNGVQACYNIPNRLGRLRPPTAYICARWPYSHHKLNTVRLRSSEKNPCGLCGSLGRWACGLAGGLARLSEGGKLERNWKAFSFGRLRKNEVGRHFYGMFLETKISIRDWGGDGRPLCRRGGS